MQIWVGLYSHYNASLPGYSYLSLFSISFLFCMGMATIQLRLRTWFGVLASCARHIAEPPALAARDHRRLQNFETTRAKMKGVA